MRHASGRLFASDAAHQSRIGLFPDTYNELASLTGLQLDSFDVAVGRRQARSVGQVCRARGCGLVLHLPSVAHAEWLLLSIHFST
jgi:hypothetical protein